MRVPSGENSIGFTQSECRHSSPSIAAGGDVCAAALMVVASTSAIAGKVLRALTIASPPSRPPKR
jgi:hypothetical protein